MPHFFSFQQGSERAQNVRYLSEASPLLGRFRVVPRPSDRPTSGVSRTAGGIAGGGGGSGGGRGRARVTAEAGEGQSEEEEGDGDAGKEILCVAVLEGAVAWCAVPFPQYPLPSGGEDGMHRPGEPQPTPGTKVPGHGAARVQVNFWFFLFVYYSFYNLTALIWITKVFNIYSLNWWPPSLGFPITVSAIAILSIAVPIPIYLVPNAKFLTVHNTAWISWTFLIMAMPVAIAFCLLMTHERHLGLRHSLSETQRIFTSSWWAGDPDRTLSNREGRRYLAASDHDPFDSTLGASAVGFVDERYPRRRLPVRLRRQWLPASFVRFVWFCLALSIGLLAYVIGEAYAEIYLSTLPHNNWETIVYVYGWITTVHLLDGLTGWILGGNEGERVGSYPLSWIFKLYFMLTYQTYVRALYARLRSPSQFILLQVLSSAGLIIVTPILMSAPFHWFLSAIGVSGQSYGSYQKMCIRNVFIRFLAENASMLAFLGSVVVLHFGANKNVYPYFAFDGTEDTEDYDFNLTFYASTITWGCELVASFLVSGLIRWIYKVSVVTEGKLDFIVWPELLPTCVAVMLHVLQNMLFSIIRLQFR
ncbi:766c2110-6a98-414c-8f04-bd692192055c [Thermothielavioides terrestris]|uniref:766c2110-6a98-414c-8f04-bd692192055c n=1 Tax=Thermothielavioides terrestris TaxID=2587410 RepID=A0A446B671_9PEZI|nr:766c2110-6a98-414c-8f04-bd692192055c [Thermothielavioides terrestris]